MKSFQNTVLSVLLFSFMLTILHDYAFVDTYSTYQQDELCSIDHKEIQTSEDKEEVKIQMHNCFHVLLEVSLMQKESFSLLALNEKPFYHQEDLTSYVQTVLLRPPSLS